jgi:RNA polymerase sigma-70 factor, ECF subfamily
MNCDTTDPNLLKSLQDFENTDAWVRFERLYRTPILDHCRSMGLTLDQAEEVIQDSFIKCFRYLPSFEYSDAVGRFRAWLNLTVNQRIADQFRNSIRSEDLKVTYAAFVRDFSENATISNETPSTFEYELISMAFRRTQALVEPRHWQIFEAHAIHELTSSQVSRQFGVSAVLVRVTTHRVRKMLQQQWKLIQEGPF